MTRLGAVLVCVLLGTAHAAGSPAERRLARIVVSGAINPAVAEFVRESIERADRDGMAALVIELDTPGGLLPSTRVIVKDILAAPVPVIVYVSPSGAGAGSAGVFITLAAHVAAMAPGTNIGAAHPVGGQGEDIKGELGRKLENFTASFGEAIAKQRGRNVEWAAKAVRKSVSITAEAAAEKRVVDFVARDLAEVVAKANGRVVEVGGERRPLGLDGARADGGMRIETYEMRLAQRLLDVIADPNIAYLLMMAGLLGLYIEFTQPGVVFPGIAGAICLLLGLTALHVLPVNYSGLALLLLGVALLVAEAFLPTFGLLGVGGLVSVVLGSLLLFDRSAGVQVARGLIAGVGGTLAVLMLAVAVLVFRSQRQRVSLGREGMVGEVGVVRQPLAPAGTVVVHGEYWSAVSADGSPLDAGEEVEVQSVDGLKLRVRRAKPRARA
jgi:membrane-bound serine protease (ClpP class)